MPSNNVARKRGKAKIKISEKRKAAMFLFLIRLGIALIASLKSKPPYARIMLPHGAVLLILIPRYGASQKGCVRPVLVIPQCLEFD